MKPEKPKTVKAWALCNERGTIALDYIMTSRNDFNRAWYGPKTGYRMVRVTITYDAPFFADDVQ